MENDNEVTLDSDNIEVVSDNNQEDTPNIDTEPEISNDDNNQAEPIVQKDKMNLKSVLQFIFILLVKIIAIPVAVFLFLVGTLFVSIEKLFSSVAKLITFIISLAVIGLTVYFFIGDGSLINIIKALTLGTLFTAFISVAVFIPQILLNTAMVLVDFIFE